MSEGVIPFNISRSALVRERADDSFERPFYRRARACAEHSRVAHAVVVGAAHAKADDNDRPPAGELR